MKVTHVVLSLDVGGLERIVVDLVRHGSRLGQNVSVLCLERPGTLAPAAQAAGATVVCVDKKPGLRPGIVRPISHALADLGCDVVHTHQIGALIYAGPAARRGGARAVIHTEHGKNYARRFRTRVLGRLAARWADKFVGVSRDIADEVAACGIIGPGKLCVLANGIDTAAIASAVADPAIRSAVRSEFGIEPSAQVIGTLGRLSEIKRQELLIRGFADLRKSHTHAHLLIVGDGPMRNELQSLAESLGVQSRVHFAGYQSQPQRFLAAMDFFALTSRSEGMPLAVLEAWAAGLPVVASRVGGIPELIAANQSGLLFESGDAAALTAAMDRLLDDVSLAANLRAEGRRRVMDQYTIERTARDYQDLYEQCLRASTRGAPPLAHSTTAA